MAALIAGSAMQSSVAAQRIVSANRAAARSFTSLRPSAARQSVKVRADPQEKAQQTASGDSYQVRLTACCLGAHSALSGHASMFRILRCCAFCVLLSRPLRISTAVLHCASVHLRV